MLDLMTLVCQSHQRNYCDCRLKLPRSYQDIAGAEPK
jgi:hypothetical protein